MATTIRIADGPHPKFGLAMSKSDTQSTRAPRRGSMTNDDGIYNIRSRSRGPSRAPSREFKPDEDPGLRKEGDYRHAQVRGDKVVDLL